MSSVSRRGFLGAVGAVGAVAASAGVAGASPRTVLAQAGHPSGLTVDGDRFLLDGKPFQIVSGAVHYFRIHPDLWRDRLLRLRAMGLNTVETYVAWNFHEPRRGEVDFDGWRDLPRFVRTAGELGLKVVFRPGPYICAEWDLGGLPPWLLANPETALRCGDPEYTRAVDTWFAHLIPTVAPLQASRGGPVIAVQVENEYGSYGNDQEHLRHIAELLRRHGIDSLLFCSNGTADYMLRGGNLPDVLATANFSGDPKEPFDALRRYQPHGPLWCTEFWNGWFDHWGEKHHVTDPAKEASHVDRILAAGGSVNLYMAAGSTNFGWGSGANFDDGSRTYQPTVTSYDYDAPVSESGELTEKFHRLRAVIGKYVTLPDEPLPASPARLPARTVRPTQRVGLLDSLGRLAEPVRVAAPVPMERLGQPHGLIHYRTTVQGPRAKRSLRVPGLGDRALVFLDGKEIGLLDRNKPDQGVDVAVTGDSARLELLVDAGGRLNFGQNLNDTKGIRGNVLLGAQALFNWEIFPLPLDDLRHLRFSSRPPTLPGPVFHRATLRVDQPADGFLALPGWRKGLLWLNGFLLGRYWDIGPQRTLYAPAPLWRPGVNELIALELHHAGPTIELREAPDLG
ncbi:glycoside hydrolase family 35 protein [Streptoalloteichus hindustanus]|uniref:Beta-galactosidase n=1 Tax=Streptoalloteichus hindustanus TaxID=2017 RepID=A0A1M5PUZ0_STRHI|nr:beta-galactosidase family protein [Streptoalloteichus hindustanus]SHH05658.1 beta-galactosidase [Streptoalloteichus hindustanus]